MGLLFLWVNMAQAQTAQTAPAAQDNAAMERAQREADGPRRRIIEAARAKATVKAPDAPPTQQPPAPAPATAQRAAPRTENARPDGVMAVLAPATPPLEVQGSGGDISGIAPVAPVGLAASAPSMINVPGQLTAAQLASLLPPRLLSRVDPDLPPQMVRRGARRTEMLVEMVINVDGSVRDVALPVSHGADVDEPVIQAVRQWRFEPQPVARPYQVRLVLVPS